MKNGVIFDLDGVIIDSSKPHEKSWELLALEENLILPSGHFKKSFGMKNEIIIPSVLKWTNDQKKINLLSFKKEILYREIIAEEGLKPLPGVLELLSSLKHFNIPCAIGSSTPSLNLEATMKLLNIEGYFTATVCGDEVENGKPDPEVFTLAAQRIGCKPENCIVIEDAPVGILAAHNGGMKVIAVATTHPNYELKEADIVVSNLTDLDNEKLFKLFSSPHSYVV